MSSNENFLILIWKADIVRPINSGMLKGLNESALGRSSCAIATKARVMPHPGHSMPVNALNGQTIGLSDINDSLVTPINVTMRKTKNHMPKARALGVM